MANYVDPLLTNLARGYTVKGHLNEIILPVIPVKLPTAKIMDQDGANMRLISSVKSPLGKTPTIDIKYETADSYTLVENAVKVPISEKDLDNEVRPFNGLKQGQELTQDVLSIAREYALASWMGTVGNFSNSDTLSGTAQWGGSADDPVGDISLAIQTAADAAHVDDEDISLVFPRSVFRILQYDDDIMDNLGFKYNRSGGLTKEDIRRAFGVKQVLVPGGRYNTAEKGQTDSFSAIWGKHAWAVYINPRPTLKELSFGYTPRRKAALMVDKWWANDEKVWYVRCTDEYDQYIMNETAAYMIEDAVA
jgi:hypothetical protein